DYGGIGDGFGFPVRFKIEASDDPEFKKGVITIADHTDADYVNPGVVGQKYPADKATIGRYVRLTATRLAHRTRDYILAVAELEVFDKDGTNVARGARVTAMDSIEAAPRWAKKNLTDGHAIGRGGKSNVVVLKAERAKLFAGVCTPETEKTLKELTNE